MSQEWDDYSYAMDVLKGTDQSCFCELEQLIEGFPLGIEGFLGRRWIINAIDCGSKESVQWILSWPVDLSFRDEEGYTVLHAALERDASDRYEVLEQLLRHGAPINQHGINDWTPSHMAAVREDIQALELLTRYGADLTVRTRIDDCATPLEEARNLRKLRAVEFLERESNRRGA